MTKRYASKRARRLGKAMLALLLLSGCTGLGIFAAPFDPVEFNHVNDALHDTQKARADCDLGTVYALPDAESALDAVERAALYAHHIPDDSSIATALDIVKGKLEELRARVTDSASEAYCQIKTDEITKALDTIETSLGKEHRP